MSVSNTPWKVDSKSQDPEPYPRLKTQMPARTRVHRGTPGGKMANGRPCVLPGGGRQHPAAPHHCLVGVEAERGWVFPPVTKERPQIPFLKGETPQVLNVDNKIIF